MPARLVIIVITGILLNLSCMLITCTHNFEHPLPNGIRKSVVLFLYKANAYLWMFVCGLFFSHKNLEVDYTTWLGPDYKSKFSKIKAVSTVISNHVSWLDT